MQQLLLDIHPAPAPGFDNFVIGRNAAAVAAVRLLASSTDAHQAIYLWGATGSGCSHLVQSALSAALAADRQVSGVDACTLPDPRPGTMVFADNLEAMDEARQHALFCLFNLARERRLGLLLAGSMPPVSLPLREDLRTRVGSALIFELQPLSDAQMAAALLQTARRRGMRLDRELVDYLLRRERRDLPYLTAVLESLDRTSLALQRPPTLPLLRQMLGGELPNDAAGMQPPNAT